VGESKARERSRDHQDPGSESKSCPLKKCLRGRSPTGWSAGKAKGEEIEADVTTKEMPYKRGQSKGIISERVIWGEEA